MKLWTIAGVLVVVTGSEAQAQASTVVHYLRSLGSEYSQCPRDAEA
jgi:hypothetical protein